jgi:hypothetical protein
MIDPKSGYLRRALKLDLATLMLPAIDTPNVVKMRNKVGKAFGFWTGNYAVTVLSTMFSWGILYGHLTVNTAKGVPALDRPEDLEAQHRSCTLAGAIHHGGKLGVRPPAAIRVAAPAPDLRRGDNGHDPIAPYDGALPHLNGEAIDPDLWRFNLRRKGSRPGQRPIAPG